MVASSSSEKPPMGRPRKHNKHLPPCVYLRHGAYWLVKAGKWARLGETLPAALAEYGRRFQPTDLQGPMVDLIRDAMEAIRKAGKIADSTLIHYEVAAKKLEYAALKRGMAGTPNMFNRCLALLRQVFSYAVDEEIIDDNPAMSIERFKEAKRGYPMLTEEPLHCAMSILSSVASLYEARLRIKHLEQWIAQEGETADVCTKSILGKVCANCRCGKARLQSEKQPA